jgi:hypothetical protein
VGHRARQAGRRATPARDRRVHRGAHAGLERNRTKAPSPIRSRRPPVPGSGQPGGAPPRRMVLEPARDRRSRARGLGRYRAVGVRRRVTACRYRVSPIGTLGTRQPSSTASVLGHPGVRHCGRGTTDLDAAGLRRLVDTGTPER